MPDAKHDDELIAALRELAAGSNTHGNDAIVPPGKRRCPICSKAMNAVQMHGIAVDVCDEHGVWLDRGELAAMLERAYLARRTQEQKPQESSSVTGETSSKLRESLNRVASMLRA